MLAKIEILLQMLGLAFKRFLEGIEQLFQPKSLDQATIYSKVGEKYADKGRMDQAIVSLKTAIKLNPSGGGAYYKLGLAYSEKGLWDEAITCYKRILKLEPNGSQSTAFDKAEIYTRLGLAYNKKDMIDKAISSYRKSVKIFSRPT